MRGRLSPLIVVAPVIVIGCYHTADDDATDAAAHQHQDVNQNDDREGEEVGEKVALFVPVLLRHRFPVLEHPHVTCQLFHFTPGLKVNEWTSTDRK